MKQWSQGVLIAALVVIAASAVHAGPGDDLVAAVKAREAERQRAMIGVDLPALEELLAADATYIHSNGLAQTKNGFIAMLAKKELRYVSFDIQEATFRVFGETVVVTGTQSIELTSSGRPFTSNSRYTVVYATIDGKPRMVAYQSTLLPEIVLQETHRGE